MNPQESNNYPESFDYTPTPPAIIFPAGRRELVFAAFSLILCLLTTNCFFAGGINLGYGLSFCGLGLCSLVYLGRRLRFSGWSIFLLVCVLALAAVLVYSNDGFVKFIVLCLMLFGWFQTLANLTGTTANNPGSIRSLGDGAVVAFDRSFREMGSNLRGLGHMETPQGVQKRKTGAVLAGLALSVPILLVVVPLLVASDAAFEGLIEKAVFFDTEIMVSTLIFGLLFFLPVFSRNLTLRRQTHTIPQVSGEYPGKAPAITLNTILIMVSIFYLLYLLSQLAYFFSGFSGILPEGFTSSEYARRGFFEMCALCAINLGLLTLCLSLVRRVNGQIPLLTRLLSLFVCLFCLVLVSVSISKMSLYIAAYGLTRLRVLTTIFDLCLGIAILCVGIWLLNPRFPYMKVILGVVFLAVICTGFMDVDTQVARYNVKAYQTGKLETIDLETLEFLSGGATEPLVSLLQDDDPEVASEVGFILARRLEDSYTWVKNEDGTIRFIPRDTDLRGWNLKGQQGEDALASIAHQLIDELVEMGYMDGSYFPGNKQPRPAPHH